MNKPTDALKDATTLVIRRSFDTDIESLFKALTDAQAMAEWFGPGKVKVRHAESDLRPGGKWVLEMVGEDGGEHNVSGEYVEIDAPRKVVFTWVWATSPDQVSQVTYALSPGTDGNTTLTLTHERLRYPAVQRRWPSA